MKIPTVFPDPEGPTTACHKNYIVEKKKCVAMKFIN